jgi:hypothetical protein
MKNPSSLFLTLVSYLIMLATLVFLLFAVMPPSLKAQTNITSESATNLPSAAVVVTQSVVEATSAPVAAVKPESNRKVEKALENANAWASVPGASGLGILVPLAPFVMPVFIIGVIFYSQYRRHKMANDTLRAMIDKGMPITPELVDSLKSKRPVPVDASGNHLPRQRNDIRLGLILVGVGTGVVMLAGKPGWIIVCLGAAFLAIGLFERNNSNNNPPPQPPVP